MLSMSLLGVEGKMKAFIHRMLSCFGVLASGILQKFMSSIIADFIVFLFFFVILQDKPNHTSSDGTQF